jgi:acylphosphatase
MSLVRCTFIVSGRVQGVFFRKYTKLKADELEIHGWCRNTPDGQSVEGILEGIEERVNSMLYWLEHVGSPTSGIEKFHVQDLCPISVGTLSGFEIKKV